MEEKAVSMQYIPEMLERTYDRVYTMQDNKKGEP